MKRPKRPGDFAQVAKFIVDIATGQAPPEPLLTGSESKKASAGRRGGLRGGKARAASLSPKKRREIARRAAATRWKHPT